MDFQSRRNRIFEQMENQSVLILYSGAPLHVSADEYYNFEANRNFFYLTGLRRENMILVMLKCDGAQRTTLYIEEADPAMERWTGVMVTPSEAQAISGVDNVRYLDRLEPELSYFLGGTEIRSAYFDCYRCQPKDLPDYNLSKARDFAREHPHIQIRDLWPMVTAMRMQKDDQEVEAISKAIHLTDLSLQHVMKNLKPGKTEYQVQADYEYMVKALGAEGTSFPTIAGSGKNGTMLHYETNRDTCRDGDLILLDLGVKLEGYCSDITRTYPINGKYSPRQRQVYDIVLKANRAVAAAAKPGMPLRQLNDLCKQVLAQGCMELGLIEKESEIEAYYMHGVSHHLGIDVHDVTLNGRPLAPGAVISDEPGLYIDEWGIGIRIEDDLLITQEGCRVLSADIIRTPEEIEAFMAK